MSEEKNIQIADTGLMKLTDSGEAFRFAKAVISSGLAPKSFRTPEAVMVAWQQGAELGLKPMQSLQHIAVINGRPTVYGKAATGIVVNSGQLEIFEETFEGEGDKLTAVCKIKRRGIESIKTVRFSMADAKKAGLLQKGGVWNQYTKDMLMYKSRARAFGALFGDVLCGLPIYEDYKETKNVSSSQKHTSEEPVYDPIIDSPPEEVVEEVVEEVIPHTKDDPEFDPNTGEELPF